LRNKKILLIMKRPMRKEAVISLLKIMKVKRLIKRFGIKRHKKKP